MISYKDLVVYSHHGFNVPDKGKDTTDRLNQYLTLWGYNVIERDRGREGLVQARWGDDEVVDETLAQLRHQDISLKYTVLIGHSHGGNLCHQTCWAAQEEFGVAPGMVILINPALRVDSYFPFNTKVVCYYSPHDYVVTASLALRALPWNWFTKHPWGQAGRLGLDNEFSNVQNVNLESLMPEIKVGHSTVFKNPVLLTHFARHVDDAIKVRYAFY